MKNTPPNHNDNSPRGPLPPPGPFRGPRPGGSGGPPHGHPPIMLKPGVDFLITKAVPQYTDLAYASASPTQKLDLYLPQGEGPFPLVILVHGGGFMFGDKSDLVTTSGTDHLIEQGYAVASVNYRLSAEAKAPAQIQDLKTAVRWLRAHAREYHLDAARFGAWGGSAGGNLVALLGTSHGVAALDGVDLGYPDESSEIQAVIDWFGPIDFLKMDEQFTGIPEAQTHDAPDSPESVLIGVPIQTQPDLVRAVNAITYISPSSAPHLIEHGTADRNVPPQQSKMLYEALLPAIGAENVELVFLEGAGHGGGPQFWDHANLALVLAFLEKHLKRHK